MCTFVLKILSLNRKLKLRWNGKSPREFPFSGFFHPAAGFSSSSSRSPAPSGRLRERMDLEAVRSSLEASGGDAVALPRKFFEVFVLHGLRIDLIEPGRVLCSMPVPPRLASTGNFLHGGATAMLVDLIGSAVFYSVGLPTSGVSLEISISYMDAAFIKEEIEIEAKLLHAGKAVGVTSVELRRKGTGKIIAQARHAKYLAVSSKLPWWMINGSLLRYQPVWPLCFISWEMGCSKELPIIYFTIRNRYRSQDIYKWVLINRRKLNRGRRCQCFQVSSKSSVHQY